MVRRPHRTAPRPDGDPFKRFPNGLRATLKSIRKFWHGAFVHEGAERNVDNFAKRFLTTYNEVASRYGRKPKTQASLKSLINKLESSGEEGTDITFTKMRAYAEFVGIPTGLLLLFSQAVSHEAQGRNREEIKEFIIRCRLALGALENYAARARTNATIFHNRAGGHDPRAEYYAQLDSLTLMCRNYADDQSVRQIIDNWNFLLKHSDYDHAQ
jgi:hypothetical protein